MSYFKSKELKEKRGEVIDAQQALVEAADKDNRDLTGEEKNKYDELENKYQKLTREIEGLSTFDNDDISYQAGDMRKQPSDNRSQWVDPNTGKEVRVLQKDDKLYSPNSGFDDFDMAKAIRALATGDYSGAQNEVRAMDLSGNAAVVPEPISQRLIDRARDMMVLNQMGMQTVPMSSSSLTFARVDSDPSTEWKAENSSFTNSDVGISGVTLSAKTIISGVTLSHELAADSPNASQVVEDTIAKAIASEIDRAGLLGSGTGAEPQGIFGHSGVTDTALAAIPSYDDFSDLYFRLKQNNENPNGLVAASRTMQTLDQLRDGSDRYLSPPQSWGNFQKAATNAVPTDQGAGNDESIAIMGDFTQLFQGIRENLRIEVSREASDSSSNAWQDLQVKIRVYSRVDFALGRTGAFQTLSGILS